MKKPFLGKRLALITLAISLRRHYPDQVKGFTLSLVLETPLTVSSKCILKLVNDYFNSKFSNQFQA